MLNLVFFNTAFELRISHNQEKSSTDGT